MTKRDRELAIEDIFTSLRSWRLWTGLAWQDIRARYRRSILGPFWITISMGVTIAATGPLYGSLFKVDILNFIPYLAMSLILWGYISGQILEYPDTFCASGHLLKQTKLPLSMFVFRVAYRHILILLHNAIIIVILFLLSCNRLTTSTLYFLPAFLLVNLILICVGLILAILCTRYRDMAPAISSLVTLFFFMTPVVWQTSQLPEKYNFLLQLNPVFYMIEILRKPLMGQSLQSQHWVVISMLALFLAFCAISMLIRFRRRITYWI